MLNGFKIFNKANRSTSFLHKLKFSSATVNHADNASKYIRIKDEDRNGLIRRIIMVNDKEKNALSLNAIKHLKKSICDTDLETFRMIILTAEQRNVFSSGHNLKELTCDKSSDYHSEIFDEMTALCSLLRNLPIPTIAEVYGLAAAAGCQMALSCDLVVASDKALFSTPGVKFGVFCSTPGVALAKNTSQKLAMKMLLTGDAISADEALKYGLISDVVECSNLETRVNQLAEKINSNSKPIIALGKKCFYEQATKPIAESYQVASRAMLENLKYVETQDGLKAFALKKKPVWTHDDKKTQ